MTIVNTTRMSEIDINSREYARKGFIVGDTLLEMGFGSVSSIPKWTDMIRAFYPEMDARQFIDLPACVRIAMVFDQAERDLYLPWGVYDYAAQFTTDPQTWVQLVSADHLSLEELQDAIYAVESASKREHEEDVNSIIYLTIIYAENIYDSADGKLIGRITVHRNILEPSLEPIVKIDLVEDMYTYQDSLKIFAALTKCHTSVDR